MSLLDRVWTRAAREAVTRLGMPPGLFGNRYLPRIAPSALDYLEIDPPGMLQGALPRNVRSREELPRDRGTWGFSFYDVPERRMRATYAATVRNCRILTAYDEWQIPFYALVAEGPALVDSPATGFDPRKHGALIRREPEIKLPKAIWFLEQWDRNYAHWVEWHLTKLALVRERWRDDLVIMPTRSNLTPVVDRSVALLGLKNTIPLPAQVVAVDELTFIGIDDFRPSLLTRLRSQLEVPERRGSRRLFISREGAGWRRLTNEEEIWSWLATRGFERVFMEGLSFDEQIALMRDAQIILSPHGGGLANAMFAPRTAHVIEISSDVFPNPQYYALSTAIGQPYWRLRAIPGNDNLPGYQSMGVSLVDLQQVVHAVEGALELG